MKTLRCSIDRVSWWRRSCINIRGEAHPQVNWRDSQGRHNLVFERATSLYVYWPGSLWTHMLNTLKGALSGRFRATSTPLAASIPSANMSTSTDKKVERKFLAKKKVRTNYFTSFIFKMFMVVFVWDVLTCTIVMKKISPWILHSILYAWTHTIWQTSYQIATRKVYSSVSYDKTFAFIRFVVPWHDSEKLRLALRSLRLGPLILSSIE